MISAPSMLRRIDGGILRGGGTFKVTFVRQYLSAAGMSTDFDFVLAYSRDAPRTTRYQSIQLKDRPENASPQFVKLLCRRCTIVHSEALRMGVGQKKIARTKDSED
jgi:hypothetical protein